MLLVPSALHHLKQGIQLNARELCYWVQMESNTCTSFSQWKSIWAGAPYRHDTCTSFSQWKSNWAGVGYRHDIELVQ